MSDFLIMYGIKASLDIGGETPTFKPFCKGWENLTEALNEVVYSTFYLCDEGFGSSEVTAMQPAFTLTGKRVVGDELQDYIFATERKYALGEARKSTFKIEVKQLDNSIQTITCPVTLTNIQEWSGNAQDGSSVSVEIRFNGKPTFGTGD